MRTTAARTPTTTGVDNDFCPILFPPRLSVVRTVLIRGQHGPVRVLSRRRVQTRRAYRQAAGIVHVIPGVGDALAAGGGAGHSGPFGVAVAEEEVIASGMPDGVAPPGDLSAEGDLGVDKVELVVDAD